MHMSKDEVGVQMQIPGAVLRQRLNFGDATGYGKISGEYFTLSAGVDTTPLFQGLKGNSLPNNVIERFGSAGIAYEGITCERDSYVFDFKGSPADFVDTFRHYYGPTMNAFDAAGKAGKADQLRSELVTLFESQNQCQYPGRTLTAAKFLKVTVEVG